MKFFIRCFTVLLVFGLLLPGTGLILPAAAESLYIRKIVSVVYDDSSSMMQDEWGNENYDKWANANYAMQTFCGLLGVEDRLFMTYMYEVAVNPGYRPVELDLSAAKIDESLASVRGRRNAWNTPYAAVETAFDKLKSVRDDNPNTRYWLVVITDGDFTEDYSSEKLDELFGSMTGTEMPNGTKPQITFLAIGDEVTHYPAQQEDAGIFTYFAETPGDIPGVMSEMADRVSGKTKIDKSKIKQIDDRTVRVSSSLPLLSIAVLAQKTDAVITEVTANGEVKVPIVRSAELMYPGYDDLTGGAFLLGDSQNVIAGGDYDIRFDRAVSAENLTVLYEPALELRMTLSVNGEEAGEFYDLSRVTENDTLGVTCGIYEMGTDTEIPPDRLPENTAFRLEILEDGEVTWESTDKEMYLDSYDLHHVTTAVRASVEFEGFRPIRSVVEFLPSEPPAVYTVTGAFRDDVNHVRYDTIAENGTTQAEFTIYADGEAITDPDITRSLNPKITVTPAGNGGDISISGDGKIVYTPKTAGLAAEGEEFFDATVTCTAEDAEASLTYRVVIADYEILAEPVEGSVAVTEFYGNTVGTSFRILKDGTPLSGADVPDSFVITLNDEYSHLVTDTEIAADGTITCVPHDPDEYVLNFKTWWTNWFRYFRLERADVTVRFEHPCGIAEAVLPVTEAALSYQLLCVYAPLLLELLLIAAVTAYLIRYFTKARFPENAVLCIGDVTYNSFRKNHTLENFCAYPLKQYNTFRCLWNPFRELTVPVGGTVPVTALHGGRIRCEKEFPWYGASIQPEDPMLRNLRTAQDVLEYLQVNEHLKLKEIQPHNVIDDINTVLVQDEGQFYIVDADVQLRKMIGGGEKRTLDYGTIICYTVIP